ncbi:hypothetical protein MMC09_006321 [Bachmanniomyces sp. S44760]|nr:hypothetical protein [Bachmanniomyces sp. S44760]
MASKETPSTSETKKRFELSNRGTKGSSPLGTTTWIALRLLDPVLQFYLISRFTHQPFSVTTFKTLTPYQYLLLGLSLGSAVKQTYWVLFTSLEVWPVSSAVPIAIYNSLMNSLNTTWASYYYDSSAVDIWTSPSVILGSTLFVSGIFVEAIAETQRTAFKLDPKNKGKPYSGGLFSLARSINYGGYTAWRGGAALCAGGPVWGGVVATWLFWDFTNRAIPVMDDYCTKRYGEAWQEVKRKVPYLIFPGIY